MDGGMIMWVLVRLGIGLMIMGSLSAMHSITAAVSRMTMRRSSVLGALANNIKNFKADVAIVFEEALGPRDPFLLHLKPTPENHAFEELVMQRRIEQGLPPLSSKR